MAAMAPAVVRARAARAAMTARAARAAMTAKVAKVAMHAVAEFGLHLPLVLMPATLQHWIL